MKRIALSILFLLVLCVSVALAALTKTTSIIELDAWQAVDPASVDVGAAGNVSDSYSTLLYIEIAYASTAAQDGVTVIVEVSYGDDDWTFLTTFTTQGEVTQDGTVLDEAAVATESTVTITDIGDFQIEGQKFFIESAGPESMRIKSVSGAVVTLCHDLLRSHADLSDVWAFVKERVIPIPAGFAFVRVIINNTDANADIYYTTRISKVTGL